MITGKDISPRRQIYYIGGLILGVLEENKGDDLTSLDVFEKLSKQEKTTFNLFSLALDWLFLLDAIILDKTVIKKCF